MIVGLLVGVQGAAFVLTAFWANRVVVKDESVFATARLLRPVLDRLGDEGTAMDGNDICKALDGENGGKGENEGNYIYAGTRGGNGMYQVELRNWSRNRTFLEGVYK